jgi:hypothetical protein
MDWASIIYHQLKIEIAFHIPQFYPLCNLHSK